GMFDSYPLRHLDRGMRSAHRWLAFVGNLHRQSSSAIFVANLCRRSLSAVFVEMVSALRQSLRQRLPTKQTTRPPGESLPRMGRHREGKGVVHVSREQILKLTSLSSC